MNRSVVRRSPKKLGGFSWSRFPMGDNRVVAYRLFRRDHAGALHFVALNFYHRDTRRDIATAMRAACHRLRDQVYEIDLSAMEVEA